MNWKLKRICCSIGKRLKWKFRTVLLNSQYAINKFEMGDVWIKICNDWQTRSSFHSFHPQWIQSHIQQSIFQCYFLFYSSLFLFFFLSCACSLSYSSIVYASLWWMSNAFTLLSLSPSLSLSHCIFYFEILLARHKIIMMWEKSIKNTPNDNERENRIRNKLESCTITIAQSCFFLMHCVNHLCCHLQSHHKMFVCKCLSGSLCVCVSSSRVHVFLEETNTQRITSKNKVNYCAYWIFGEVK